MSTYIMFGKYTAEGFANMSPERTEKVMEIIKDHDGEIQKLYATLGQFDLLFLVDFPSTEEAVHASISISKFSGINFTTAPALPIEMFDKLISGKLLVEKD